MSDPNKPYGDVQYADPGYQKDGKKRYPIDTEAHCRAAWSYINQADNAAKYTADQVAKIKARIRAAGKKFGIEFASGSENRSERAGLAVAERPLSIRNEPVEIRSAKLTSVDFEERVIEILAVPYNEEAAVPYNGHMLLETIAPGAFDGIETRDEHVSANREHNYERTFGKVVSYRTDDPAGLRATIYVSDTELGNDTLRLTADGVLKPSVGMLVRRSDQILKNGTRRIKRAFLEHVSMVPNPAYRGAGVLAVRQERGLSAEEQPPPAPTPNLDKVLQLLGMTD